MLYTVNKDVYTRLQELLLEEQAQREQQEKYLKHASTVELEALKQRLSAHIAELDGQYAEQLGPFAHDEAKLQSDHQQAAEYQDLGGKPALAGRGLERSVAGQG